MFNKKISFGICTGGISLGIESIIGFMMYPLLLNFLNQEIAGFWFICMSFNMFSLLAQCGLGPVITRQIAISFSTSSLEVFSQKYQAIRRCYNYVFGIVIFFGIVMYLIYIRKITIYDMNSNEVLAVWIFIVIGFSIKTYAMHYLFVINGLGEVGWDKILQIVISIITFLFYYIVINLFGKLIFMGISFLLLSGVYLLGAWFLFKKIKKNKNIIIYKGLSVYDKDVENLIRQGISIFILNLSGMVVMNSDIYIVERFFGVGIVPYYSAMTKMMILIISVSALIQQMVYPYIAMSWAKREYIKCWILYKKAIFSSILLCIIVSSIMFICASCIFKYWIGDGKFLGNFIFGLQLLFALIYVHHNAHANSVIATSEEKFIFPAIINAVLVIIISLYLAQNIGLEGVVMGMILGTIIPSIYVVRKSYQVFVRFKDDVV